jgi:hypothetical protein
MYADHTLLLEEGEAFLALNEALGANKVVAMRSPSYIAGNLRKLGATSTQLPRSKGVATSTATNF